MPTRRSEVEARGEGHLHHRGLTLPAAQMHHSGTRQLVEGIHGLDAHADAGMAYRCQKDLVAVIMGAEGGVTAPTGHLIELMEK